MSTSSCQRRGRRHERRLHRADDGTVGPVLSRGHKSNETLEGLRGWRRVLRLECRDLAIEVPQLDAVALSDFTEPLRPLPGGLIIGSSQIVAVDNVAVRPNDEGSIVRHGRHPPTPKINCISWNSI